jgi:transportin-1
MRDFVEPILRELIPILLKHDELNRSLLENTAITIGRLALVAPEVGAPLLDSFIAQWSICLRSIRDDIEKQHAFQGLARMVALNPRAPLHCMQHLCDAFASWGHPPPELNEQMQQILQGYKTSLPQDQWGQFMQSLPQDLRNRLIERYQL